MNCVEYEYSVYYNVISYNHVGSWLVLGGYRDFFDCAEVVDDNLFFLLTSWGMIPRGERNPEMLTVEFGAFPMRVAVGNVSIVPRRQGVSDRCKNMEPKVFSFVSFVDGIDGHGYHTRLQPSRVCMLPCWSYNREVPGCFDMQLLLFLDLSLDVFFQHK